MPRTALFAVVVALVTIGGWQAVGRSSSARVQERDPQQQPPSATSETADVPTGVMRPNVVIVVIDDMAWEDLASTPVPVLDDLRRRGRVYTNFYVCPVCSPSRVALQFGRYAYRDGVFGSIHMREPRNQGMPLERTALPEVLGPAGYTTAIFGKWHISTDQEVALATAAQEHGYDVWRAGHPSNIGHDSDSSQSDWLRHDDGRLRHSNAYSALAITNAFVQWWRRPSDGPRLAVVAYTTPHEPFTPPPVDLLPPGVEAGEDARSRYEASLSALDTLIGRVVANIDLSNTYVFVFPDNGTPDQVRPPGGEYAGYKGTFHQGGIHVPLVVLGPDVQPGTSSHLIHVVDVPRTVFELCGVPCEIGFEDSRSFAPTLKGAEFPPREPIFVHHRAPNSPTGPWERDLWAVIDADGWKLTSESGRTNLFDLSHDPLERNPVQDPTRRERLAAIAQAIVVP